MPHTDETWTIQFGAASGAAAGSRDRATVQTVHGQVLLALEPPAADRSPGTEAVRESFEDNARLAGSARQLLIALDRLVQVAVDAGLPADAPAVGNALAALEQARPSKFDVVHDGARKFRGSRDECVYFVKRAQDAPVEHALQYDGWSIEPAAGPAPKVELPIARFTR